VAIPLEDHYRIVRFADAESVEEGDVVEFWDREDAVPRDAARERLDEVAFVGLEEQDGLVAVSTVYLARNSRLGMDLWHYRTFVGRNHRRSALAENLTIRVTEHLREEFVSGRDRRAAGVFIRVENQILKTVKNEAVWPDTRYAFIGEDESGNHCRVHYFPGALAPPPP
jgi:hypothetical protein